jgi:hypothetical protein
MGTKFLPLSAETKCALNTWQNSGAWSNYETGKFTRAELIRWILAIGMKSVYPFSMDKRIRLDLEADPDRTPEQWRAHVKEVLEKHNGNKTHAAKELGITRTRVGQLTTTDKVERKPLALSPQDPFGIAKKPVSNRRS